MNLRAINLLLLPLAMFAADGVVGPLGSLVRPQAARLADSVVLDIKSNKPTRPGFRAYQPEVITTVPFTPLSRLTSNSLEYLLPLIRSKISGVIVAGDASAFSYEGREIHVGGTIKYPRRTGMNLAAYFTDTSAEKPEAKPSASTEGVLRVRAIREDRIIFIDEVGYELPVPVNINNEDNQAESTETPLRVQTGSYFAVGVLSADGESVLVRLPLGLAPNTVMRIFTRFAMERTFVLQKFTDGVALLHVDGEPLVRPKAADMVPPPRMKGWYALGVRGGAEGFDLLGFPLEHQGAIVKPRGGVFDASLITSMPVWRDGHLQGFADEDGHVLPVATNEGEKKDICIVIYSPNTTARKPVSLGLPRSSGLIDIQSLSLPSTVINQPANP